MSCGSKTCVATKISLNIEAAKPSTWIACVLRMLGTMLERSRRKQLWFELEKARQRGLLKDLEDWQLKDLGLSREQATREAEKPFWK